MNEKSDEINKLPTDDSSTSQDEHDILSTVFYKYPKAKSVVVEDIKDCLVIVVLFIFFSSEWVSEQIRRFVPVTRSNNVFLLGIKSIIVVFIWYIIKNFRLARV